MNCFLYYGIAAACRQFTQGDEGRVGEPTVLRTDDAESYVGEDGDAANLLRLQ